MSLQNTLKLIIKDQGKEVLLKHLNALLLDDQFQCILQTH